MLPYLAALAAAEYCPAPWAPNVPPAPTPVPAPPVATPSSWKQAVLYHKVTVMSGKYKHLGLGENQFYFI